MLSISLICPVNLTLLNPSFWNEREKGQEIMRRKAKQLISNLFVLNRHFAGTIADINVMFLWQKNPQ